jgi:hypothetical protein
MNNVMRRLSIATAEHVLHESTRLQDPDIRARFFGRASRDYEKAKRKLGFTVAKRKRVPKRVVRRSDAS